MAGRPKGQPKTGGRKKGTANTKTREIADKAAASGITPLEYMLAVMRDEQADPERRGEMARAAAPYMHPRLQTTTVKGGDEGGTIPTNIKVTFV